MLRGKEESPMDVSKRVKAKCVAWASILIEFWDLFLFHAFLELGRSALVLFHMSSFFILVYVLGCGPW